jgi:glucose-6-phosphate-specific signal transduction histidine kinase
MSDPAAMFGVPASLPRFRWLGTILFSPHEIESSKSFTTISSPSQGRELEISLIAKEAIHNACLHSKASQLRLELRYSDDLRLCFKNNGIGIDPNILETGRAGHFGLQGMMERSARIRAKITISSSRNSGTEVILRVPGEIAYERAHQPLTGRIKALFRRDNFTGWRKDTRD